MSAIESWSRLINFAWSSFWFVQVVMVWLQQRTVWWSACNILFDRKQNLSMKWAGPGLVICGIPVGSLEKYEFVAYCTAIGDKYNVRDLVFSIHLILVFQLLIERKMHHITTSLAKTKTYFPFCHHSFSCNSLFNELFWHFVWSWLAMFYILSGKTEGLIRQVLHTEAKFCSVVCSSLYIMAFNFAICNA